MVKTGAAPNLARSEIKISSGGILGGISKTFSENAMEIKHSIKQIETQKTRVLEQSYNKSMINQVKEYYQEKQ